LRAEREVQEIAAVNEAGKVMCLGSESALVRLVATEWQRPLAARWC